jgi:hypothetical protein
VKDYEKSEALTEVTMKNAVFWNVILVALELTEVSEERIASIIRVPRIGELVKDDGGDTFIRIGSYMSHTM